jgi:hypothetical protein
LSGTYEYTLYDAGEQPIASMNYLFEVSVAGCFWRITYLDTASYTNKALANVRSIATCDGTDIYLIKEQSKSAAIKAWGDRYEQVKDKLLDGLATVFPGSYPPATGSEEFVLQNIWLGFASDCVLGATEGKAKPPFLSDLAVFYSTNYSCDYYRSAEGQDLGIGKVIFASGEQFFERNLNDGRIINSIKNSAFNKGNTNGVGVWRNPTQFSGVTVPREFEFTAFSPRISGTNVDGLLTRYRYRCTVTNIEQRGITALVENIAVGRMAVTDRRFSASGPAAVQYVTTNAILSKSDTNLVRLALAAPKLSLDEEALRDLGITNRPGKWSRGAVWLFLFLPLAFFAARGLVKKQNKQT